MAKRSDYHGFDDYKNIVEAPKVYLSNEEYGNTATTVKNRTTMIGESKNSLAIMKVDTTSSSDKTGFPYSYGKEGSSGIGIATATGSGYDVFELFYDPYGNNLYISGRDAGNTWRNWALLQKNNSYLNQVSSTTAKIVSQVTRDFDGTVPGVSSTTVSITLPNQITDTNHCVVIEALDSPLLMCHGVLNDAGTQISVFIYNFTGTQSTIGKIKATVISQFS